MGFRPSSLRLGPQLRPRQMVSTHSASSRTNAPAEYGRTSGAVISVNTISGTNTYHGNLYFLVRSEAFEANQYFHKDTINPTTGAVTPRNRDPFFQEGGSFGGAIRIPHLYNGHDKTFIFVNYDRTAMPQLGDLSASLSATDANRELRR